MTVVSEVKKSSPRWWQTRVLSWYQTDGRHDLPWQHPKTPYRVWIAEIMLQQTQVKTVIPYYQRFLKAFPTLHALANAPLDDILNLWSGLGYYARARNLHRSAQQIATEHAGRFPLNAEILQSLPGIGQSTAHAILAQSDDQALAILDGNVKRVLCRFHGIDEWPEQSHIKKQLWLLAEHYMPKQQASDYTQAMMDLGATLCTRSKPDCIACPLQKKCVAFQGGAPEHYPGKKPNKKKPIRQRHFVLLTHANDLLMYQRPLEGIWGGLWSVPEFESQSDLERWLSTHCGTHYHITQELKGLKHEFTHFTLRYTGTYCTLTKKQPHLPPEYHWLSQTQTFKKGLAKPIQGLLENILIAK
jgi:A/G-specific adenine glycosylase